MSPEPQSNLEAKISSLHSCLDRSRVQATTKGQSFVVSNTHISELKARLRNVIAELEEIRPVPIPNASPAGPLDQLLSVLLDLRTCLHYKKNRPKGTTRLSIDISLLNKNLEGGRKFCNFMRKTGFGSTQLGVTNEASRVIGQVLKGVGNCPPVKSACICCYCIVKIERPEDGIKQIYSRLTSPGASFRSTLLPDNIATFSRYLRPEKSQIDRILSM